MADWNFDVSQAPRGEWVEVIEKGGRSGERKIRRYSAPKVILASKCGKVIVSHWLPPNEDEKRPVGRWNGFMPDEDVIAWQPYPEHPLA